MVEGMSDLEDRSAAGIAKAADKDMIPENWHYRGVVKEARILVADGKGHWVYLRPASGGGHLWDDKASSP